MAMVPARRSGSSRRLAAAVATTVAAAALALAGAGATARAHTGAQLLVSTSATRSGGSALDAATVSGSVAIFTSPDAGVSKVTFWLDDPAGAGPPYRTETWGPFDFNGTNGAAAVFYDTNRLANGSHTIRATVITTDGHTQTVPAAFTVQNGTTPPPAGPSLQVSTSATRSPATSLAGATLSGNAYVFVAPEAGISKVSFWLDDPTRAGGARHVEGWAPWDFVGGSAAAALPFDTRSLSNGQHRITALVEVGTASRVLDSSFTISNPVSGWTTSFSYAAIATAPEGLSELNAIAVNGKVYAFGGFANNRPCCFPSRKAYVYDPAVNTWSALADLPHLGGSHIGLTTDGARYIYYAGGYVETEDGTQQYFGTAEGYRYDSLTNTYARLPDLPQQRSAGGLEYLDGKLYFFGGNNAARTVDAVETWMLDVAGGGTAWTLLNSDFPNPRNHLGSTVVGGKIFAVGGQLLGDASKPQSTLNAFDVATGTWSTLAPLPVAVSHMDGSTFAMDGRLVVAGGYRSTGYSNLVWAYDPATNSWSSLTNLPVSRSSAGAEAIGSHRFIFFGGGDGQGWRATPAS
ncbi:MAG: kelch repeat-containing protein [Mycobacteriales bacterium]